MKKVKQVLIMAGGFGTRLSKNLNPNSCKSLILYKNQTLIAHLIDQIKEAGFSDIIIATNNHSQNAILSIAKEKGLDENLVLVEDGSTYGEPEFAGVPYNLREKLEERFLLVCGHHFVPSLYLKEMINNSNKYNNVMTGYLNNKESLEKTLFKEPNLKRTYIKDNTFLNAFARDYLDNKDLLYLRNPYIIDMSIVYASYEDKHRKPFHEYIINENIKKNLPIGFVCASMPPEFDYDWEYEDTIKYLTTNFKLGSKIYESRQ